MAAEEPEARDGEAGETMIEIVATIVVMGLAVVSLMAGMFAAGRLAARNAQVTSVRATAQSYAEILKQPVGVDLTYKDCATAASYGTLDPNLLPNPATYTVTVVDVDYASVVPDGKLTQAPVWTDSCTTDKGLQRLTVEVVVDDAGMVNSETVAIVKRDARCSGTYSNVDLGPC